LQYFNTYRLQIMTHIHRHALQVASCALLAISTSAAWSQALPQAGQVGKDSLPSATTPDTSPINAPALPSARAPSGNSATVTVTSFTFSGNTAISTEELQALVAASVGQALSFDALDQVSRQVSKLYRQRGYAVASAYLPPQQNSNGVIQIAVVEGRFGAVNLKNTSQVSDERLQQTVAQNLCSTDDGKDCVGKLVENKGLERSLLLIKDLPGVTAKANLTPGQAVGTSNLDVVATTTKANAYSLGFDNFGAPSTGTTRLNGNADLNNLANNGDQLSLGVATTTQTATVTGSLSYSLPVGYNGQRFGVAFARSQYRLGGAFASTQAYGLSNALSVFTSYPIIRSINQSVYVRASGEVRGGSSNIDSLIGTTFQSAFKTNANVVRLGINGDQVDSLGGGGYNVYSLTLSQGFLGTNNSADSTTAQTAGRFGKVNYNIARQQALSGPVTLYASLAGQQASKNLDGSEQTGLGGPASVRGYTGEGGGSTGANSTVELRYTQALQLGNDLDNLTYGLFVDRGWLKYYQSETALLNGTRSLTSYGLTLTLQSQARVPTATSIGYYVRAMYGMHGMNNGNASLVDPASKGKFWLQGGVTF
jgi:hemolysin activation/secretion protein